MFILMVALVGAFVGVLPLLFRGKIAPAVLQFVITFLLGWLILYANAPSTVWPLFGLPGFLVAIWWLVAALVDGFIEDNGEITWTALFPVVAVVVYIVIGIYGSAMLNSGYYSRMLGEVEERVWTKDVQPKDPAHMRMATDENAIYQAMKMVGAAGAIGSQFSISKDNVTLQMINGELWYIAPLDFAGFSVWTSSKGVPGYIKVHGEDPHRQPELVLLKEGEHMQYTPGAYFGYNLKRHLRNTGYLNKALSDWTFEVDESGKAWWVVTVYEPTLAWSGEKITGVAVVDPANGNHAFYPMGKVPDWVDRAVPNWVMENYLKWNGKYSGGWINSWWGKHNLTEPEDANLIYGTGDQPEWVIGITSTNSKDDSLVALIYANSRTGKLVRYKMAGGSTDPAVKEAVNENQEVKFRSLHAAAPQLYNVYDVPTSVVPLLNDAHAYQGVAMVSILDVQTVAVGRNQYEALRNYEKMLAERGQRIAVDKNQGLKIAEGAVELIGSEVTSAGTIYYVYLRGVPVLFTAGAGEAPKLPVTKEGHRVRIEYYASDRDVVPMRSFDNFSVVLSASKAQKQVRGKVEERRRQQETKDDAAEILDRMKNLTPEQLKELGKQLPQK